MIVDELYCFEEDIEFEIEEIEFELQTFCENNYIDYNNDNILYESFNFVMNNRELISEGILHDAWEIVKKFIKKVIETIIYLFKNAINFIKALLNKIREIFTGVKHPEYQFKNNHVSYILFEGAKLKEINIKNYNDLKQYVLKSCNSIIKEIKKLTNNQPRIIKQTELYIDKKCKSTLNESYIIQESNILNKKLYHADKELVDKLQPYAIDIGNKFQKPGWALFCFDKKEYAIGYMVELLLEDIDQDLKINGMERLELRYDLINNRPMITKKSLKIINDYITNHSKMYGYVYTIEQPLYKIGLGNDVGLKEYTVRDKDIVPTECIKIILDKNTLHNNITLVSKEEYDKYVYDLKNNPKKFYRWESIFMITDHKGKMKIKRAIHDAIKNGEIKKGDDISNFSESYIISKDDIYINFDKWGSENNILYITGISGSGKTTLINKLKDEYNCEVISFDNLLMSYRKGKEYDPYITKYIKTHNVKMTTWDSDDTVYESRKFLEWFNKESKNYNDKLFIIEGFQIFDFYEGWEFKDKPIIIKGTSAIHSWIRKNKRLLKNNKYTNKQKLNMFFKILNELISGKTFKDEKELSKFIQDLQENGVKEFYIIQESAKDRLYKCPYCDYKGTKVDLVAHVEDEHEEMIPKDYTPARVVYNYINKRESGCCKFCKGSTPWNEKTWKYRVICEKKSCKEKASRLAEENLKKATGMTKSQRMSNPDIQNDMLNNRKISGTYNFKGVKKTYVGSYEYKLLEFYDKVLDVSPDEIQTPGPVIEYIYKGEKHKWITDLYYVTANLVHDAKDGGDNPNNREMKDYRDKQNAKEKAIKEQGKYNYVRVTNNDFEQLLEVLSEIKYAMIDDTVHNKTICKINEMMSACSLNPVIGTGTGEYIINYGVNGSMIGNAFCDNIVMSKIYKYPGKKKPLKKIDESTLEFINLYDYELYKYIGSEEKSLQEIAEMIEETGLEYNPNFKKCIDLYTLLEMKQSSIRESLLMQVNNKPSFIVENKLDIEYIKEGYILMENEDGYYIKHNDKRSCYFESIEDIPEEIFKII